jgi:methionyl-tRNA formyltransferase
MRLIFLGTPEIAVPTLRLLAGDAEFRPALVLTQPSARRARRGKPQPSVVGSAAHELDLPWLEADSVNRGEAFERMAAIAPEVIVVVAFGQMLSKAVLALPRHGCLNLHPSLLPGYRGAAPVQRAVMDGVTDSGLTIMRLVRKMDAGPILLQQPWRLDPDKNAAELLQEAGELGAPLMLDVLRRLEGGIDAREQDHNQATFAPPLEKADGELHFARPALELHNRVRAVQPWPGAETWLERDPPLRVLVRRSSVLEGQGEPGVVRSIDAGGIAVCCGAGVLLLREIQLEGKPARHARDVANGLRLKVGEKFRA